MKFKELEAILKDSEVTFKKFEASLKIEAFSDNLK